MIRAALLLTFVGVSLAAGRGYGYKPKTFNCFVCEYKPPVTNTYEVPREEAYEVEVPVYGQDCHDEQYLAGHYVTKVEKTVHSEFRPSHDYQPNPAHEGYGADGTHGYDVQPERYEHEKPVYKTRQRCVSRVDYAKETRYRTVYDTKTEVIPAVGYPSCVGPINYGDDVAEAACYDSCFVRTDGNGYASRGCSGGDFQVDLNDPAPFVQGEYSYNFCEGNHCNNGAI